MSFGKKEMHALPRGMTTDNPWEESRRTHISYGSEEQGVMSAVAPPSPAIDAGVEQIR
jgi:hypothetical protein